VNPVTTAITLDVYLAAASFAVWVLHERRVRRPWLWALGCVMVGLAAVLPLYLALRRATAVPVSR
jgi:drug/metabolite transporter (DMT)-like permease